MIILVSRCFGSLAGGWGFALEITQGENSHNSKKKYNCDLVLLVFAEH